MRTKFKKPKEKQGVWINCPNCGHLFENHPDGKFVPPTLEQVQKHATHLGVRLDAQEFLDYWNARKWMLTKNRQMISWRQALVTWKNNSLNWGDGRVQKLVNKHGSKINVGFQGY